MSVLKIWDGLTWYTPTGFNRPKVWNGSTWAMAQPVYFSGSNNPSKTLTVGTKNVPASKFSAEFNEYGFSSTPTAYGSISTTSLPYAWGAPTITNLYWVDGGYVDKSLFLTATSSDPILNTGWTSITINSNTFTRASAGFDLVVNSSTSFTGTWTWSSVTTNPFPSVGSSTNVTWNV